MLWPKIQTRTKQKTGKKKKKAGEIWIQLWIVLIQYPGFDIVLYTMFSRWHAVVKNQSVNAGDMGSNSESGRSARVGNGNTSQYSCLENSMDNSWGTKSWTQLSMHALLL